MQHRDVNGGPRVVPLDQIPREHIEWLWPGYVAIGHLTVMAGNGGHGKSIASLTLASLLTRGDPLPGECARREPSRVLLLNAEDGHGDVLRPRAEAAGADLGRLLVVDVRQGGRFPRLPEDVPWVEQIIDEHPDVKLVIVDPLNAYLPVELDAHKDQHVRQALAPLAALAQRRKIAVLILAHLNKAKDMLALHRVSGSIGLGAAARSVMLVGPHPDREGVRVVAQAKPQLGPMPDSIGFTVVGSNTDASVGVVKWMGAMEVTADDLCQRERPGPAPDRREQAKRYIVDAVAVVGKLRRDVLEGWKKTRGSEATFNRAASALMDDGMLHSEMMTTGRGQEAMWNLTARGRRNADEAGAPSAHQHQLDDREGEPVGGEQLALREQAVRADGGE